MSEITEIPVEVLIDHLYTGGHPVIVKWMAENASQWSITQRKAIQQEISEGLKETHLSEVQKYYLLELRMALAKIDFPDNTQYA